ncbi:MAG: hypothetical protein EU548_08675, partial [Promethearchaeota archaeon]
TNNIDDGFYISNADENNISNNIITNSFQGIDIYEGNSTIMENNTISNCNYGCYLAYTNNSLVFSNYFINNSIQAYDSGINNQWDNGSIGNYWSDYWNTYFGVDLDDDGIGDIPYNITGSAKSQDRYPIWDDGPGENHPPVWDQTPSDQTLELSVSFSYDLNASDTSGIDTYWINDSIAFQIDSNGLITNITTLFIGKYWLEISVNDTYDNILSTTITITVEPTSGPSWDPQPVDQIVEYGDPLNYNVNAVDISGVDSYWINDTTNFQINNEGLITNAVLLSIRTYWLEINVNDTLGYTNSALINILVQDLTPPYWVTTPSNQSLDFGLSLSYDVSAIDPSGIDQYWVNDTNIFQIDSNGLITNKSVLTIRVYWLEINVNDTYGNILSIVIKITIQDNIDPTWDETPTNRTVELGSLFSYDVNASDQVGIDHYWVNDTSHFEIDANGVITNKISLSLITYSLKIRAYDSSDNYCEIIIQVVVEDTTSPSWVEIPSDIEINVNIPLNYDINASDLAGIDYYWINDTTNFQINNNGLITYALDLSIGVYWLEVRAYDSSDNFCSATFKITIKSSGGGGGGGIPGYSIFPCLIFATLSLLVIFISKRRKIKNI